MVYFQEDASLYHPGSIFGRIAVHGMRCGLLTQTFRGLCVPACLLNTTREPYNNGWIDWVLLGLGTWVGPRNHVLHDGGPDYSRGMGTLGACLGRHSGRWCGQSAYSTYSLLFARYRDVAASICSCLYLSTHVSMWVKSVVQATLVVKK